MSRTGETIEPATRTRGPRAAVPRGERVGRDGSPEGDRQFVAALARGLDILGCFSTARPELGGTEIAAMLGLPQPTVWRLCWTMTRLGFLVADGDCLRPALPALRLGYTVLSEMSAGELARPHLQDLADEIGGAAGLAVRDGHDMVFVERCESESQLLMSLRVGSRVPLATSALGWAYLAALPSGEREAMIAQVRPEPRIWRTAEAPLRRALGEYEQRGFVVNAGVLHPGYCSVAVPVRGPEGRPLYALNCGGAVSGRQRTRLEAEVGPRLRVLAGMLESVLPLDDTGPERRP